MSEKIVQLNEEVIKGCLLYTSIHGADRENHLSKSTNETEVDTIYPCPSKNRCPFWGTKIICIILTAVSYTHLDVYKRQLWGCPSACR